jgi:microcystin-dependent protein
MPKVTSFSEVTSLDSDHNLYAVKTAAESDVRISYSNFSSQLSTDAGSPVGLLAPFAGASAPSGWLLCDGSAVSRTTYAPLFAVIGTTYGAGDGSTTFNLPDMRAASPVGAGTSTQFTENETRVLGTAYDDQMQQITGNFGAGRMFASGTGLTASGALSRGTAPSYSLPESVASSGTDQAISFDSADSPNARTGTTTHGKQVSVNFIIKV